MSSSAEPWFLQIRTGLADPVLDRRLHEQLEGRGIGDDVRRGIVFDLVTGSKSTAEALEALSLSKEERGRVKEALERATDHEEVRTALRAVGRDDDAAALRPGAALGGGEMEARRAPPAAISLAPPTPAPVREADGPPLAPTPTPTPSTPPPVGASSSEGPSALELRALRASIDRLEARVDHVLSLLKLGSLAAVGLLILSALLLVAGR